MKWKAREEKYVPPKNTCFLLLPTLCEDGYWRWLETVRFVADYDYGYEFNITRYYPIPLDIRCDLCIGSRNQCAMCGRRQKLNNVKQLHENH